MITTGPCMICGTTQRDRVPLFKINKETGNLDDILTCCSVCWEPSKCGGKSFYAAKADWEGKKSPRNGNSGSNDFWSL